MIYPLTIIARKEEAEIIINKYNYANFSIKDNTSKIDELMGRTSLILELPSTPRYIKIMEEEGIRPGVIGANNLLDINRLEKILQRALVL